MIELAQTLEAGCESDLRDRQRGVVDERARAEAALLENQRRLENALRQLNTAQQQIIEQERLRALGQMASGIAHDFNNALLPILGYSELLLMFPKNLDDKIKLINNLNLINTAAKNAAETVKRLREFYREKSEKNLTLMGGMMLQLTITPSGEVSHVKELGSRIADAEFAKSVVAEVSQWSFQDLLSEPVIVNCPLLFVREGMDINTVVQWEKALGPLVEKSAVGRPQTHVVQDAKAAEIVKTAARSAQPPVPATPKPLPRAARSAGTIYQLKYVTTVRTDPNFSAPPIAKFPAGTKVSLISSRGDWLEVRSADGGLSGFIRREFVAPLEITRPH